MINQNITLEERDGGAVLSGIIHFESANQYCDIGTGYLRKTPLQCVCFDLSGIKQSNIAGLAVLMAWLRSAKLLDKQLTFKGIPGALLNVAEICGVDQWIN